MFFLMVIFHFIDLTHHSMVFSFSFMVLVSGTCCQYLWFCAADLFQKLFRQDLLVASLFRNFLLAERIMRAANCSPISYPMLPPTHLHHMWYAEDTCNFYSALCLLNSIGICTYAQCRDAWDMAAEICLSQLPALIEDPNAEFLVCSLGFVLVWISYYGLARYDEYCLNINCIMKNDAFVNHNYTLFLLVLLVAYVYFVSA